MTGLTFKNCDTFSPSLLGHLQIMTRPWVGLQGCLQISLLLSSCLVMGSAQSLEINPSKLTMPPSQTVAQVEKNSRQPQFLPITATATIAGRKIDLEVAKTIPQQSKGLMYRSALPDHRGMLFNFSPTQPVAFWMKNVPVALDMVFIRQTKVVAIALAVPPCQTEPCPTYPAEGLVVVDQVIELRAGLTKEIGLKIGDRIIVNPK
jgi:uncharacterized protein